MSDIVNAKDLRPGNTFIYKNNLYIVIENSFNKTAMREGIVKCKVKNLRTQSITIEVLTGEKLEKVLVENAPMTFSYIDGSNYVFMDNNTFETSEIDSAKLQWEKNFLIEGCSVNILKYNDEILGITLPDQITCNLKDVEEAVQGNTVQNVQKKGWLESGFEISVPQFVKKTDRVIINTSTGAYVGREQK